MLNLNSQDPLLMVHKVGHDELVWGQFVFELAWVQVGFELA